MRTAVFSLFFCRNKRATAFIQPLPLHPSPKSFKSLQSSWDFTLFFFPLNSVNYQLNKWRGASNTYPNTGKDWKVSPTPLQNCSFKPHHLLTSPWSFCPGCSPLVQGLGSYQREAGGTGNTQRLLPRGFQPTFHSLHCFMALLDAYIVTACHILSCCKHEESLLWRNAASSQQYWSNNTSACWTVTAALWQSPQRCICLKKTCNKLFLNIKADTISFNTNCPDDQNQIILSGLGKALKWHVCSGSSDKWGIGSALCYSILWPELGFFKLRS